MFLNKKINYSLLFCKIVILADWESLVELHINDNTKVHFPLLHPLK